MSTAAEAAIAEKGSFLEVPWRLSPKQCVLYPLGMRLRFTKMHGLGNDFIVLDAEGPHVPDPNTLRRLADRRTGIGFDQALIMEPPRQADTQVYYRTFNADGEEVEQCGNGARCIARLISERQGYGPSDRILMGSTGGTVGAQPLENGHIAVNMGVPDFRPEALPFAASAEATIYLLDVSGAEVEIGAVSIGNPHAVLTVADVGTAPVDRLGPAIEQHARFPRRTNVEFMQILDSNHIRLRVYERGTGETQACGTGACAAVAVGRKHGVLDGQVEVDLRGGRLGVEWSGPGEPIWLTGPAEKVFEGYIEL